jgi:hypothetical protein
MGAFNPQALLQMLSARGGGAVPGQPGPTSTGTGSGDEAVGNASTQLQGANPEYALKEIMDVKQRVVNNITTLAFRVPSASRALSSILKGLDAAIKELQNAQSTMQAIGGPVNLSAIPRPSPPGGSSLPSPGANPSPQGF